MTYPRRTVLVADLRYVVRRLFRSPKLFVVVVLTFAVTIGANTAVFSVGQWIQSVIYGLDPNDPATIAASIVIITFVGLGSAYFPARKTAKTSTASLLIQE